MTICLLEINPKWLSRRHLLSLSLYCYNLTISIRLKHPNEKRQEGLIWFVVTWSIKAERSFNSIWSLDRWRNQGPKRLTGLGKVIQASWLSTLDPKPCASPAHRPCPWMPGWSTQLPRAPCASPMCCSDLRGSDHSSHQSDFPNFPVLLTVTSLFRPTI